MKLTEDTGLTTDPAISADGKFLTYASDRGSAGTLNIWVQDLRTGGTSVQLTHEDAGADQPAFSPDGATVVFHGKRQGGGIYTIAAIGGEPSLLTRSGQNPRFSPDGHRITYWSGSSDSAMSVRNGVVYVVPASGGEPKRAGLDLPAAKAPIWEPDGEHLLVYVPGQNGFSWDEADWWIVSLDGTPSQQTGNFAVLAHQGFSLGFDRVPLVSEWIRDSSTFAAAFGDAINVWRAPISREGHITGLAERVTSGTNSELLPATGPDGELVFASLNRTAGVWSLPADSDRAVVTGEMKRITEGTAEFMPSLSADGSKLAFTDVHLQPSRRPGSPRDASALMRETAHLQTRIRDLSTGKEAVVPATDAPQWRPELSPDGTMVAYSLGKPGHIYASAVNRGTPRMIVPGKSAFSWGWSKDNRRILFNEFDSGGQHLYIADVTSGSEHPFLARSGFSLFQAQFSPDDRFMAVLGCHADPKPLMQCQVFIVPLENGEAVSPAQWIAVDHRSPWDDKPRWSPDGNLLYFISDRDGYLCLWAQRLAARTKQPVDAPFPVHHFHSARRSLANLDTGVNEIAIGIDKIVFGLGELTGNIWSVRTK